MKQKLSAFVILILALALGTVAPRSQTRVAVEQPLLDRTAGGEEIRVIVGVGSRFVPEGDLAADAVGSQRADIARALDDTMARAAAVGVQIGAKFDTIPYFTARVNRAQLEALATTAGVSSIGEDLLLSRTLDVSTALINAPAAWAAGHTGVGWGVAVLDTGVSTSHSFLAGKVVTQACYSSTVPAMGPNPATTSLCPGGVNSNSAGGGACSASVEGCNHGTHVAGIVAGANGPSGANGVAPGAVIHAIQVFSQVSSASFCSPASLCTTAFTSDVILGLQRVLALRNAGQQIAAVNMSLGGGLFTGANCDAAQSQVATKAAIDNLLSVGVATVIASGNDSQGFAISGPACISTAVAVGATTKGVCPGALGCPGGAQAGLPNVPVFSNHSIAVDLLAPGVDIRSSVQGGGFANFNGTSMAAPHVAGAWALLKQAAPAATPPQVLAALAGTGTSILEPFTQIPKPLINVNAARLALIGFSGGGGPPGAPTNFAVNVSGNAVSMTWVPPASGGAPVGYQLVVRTTPGGPIATTFPIGLVTAFGPVAAPNGAYSLSMRAGNAAGLGPESNVVNISVPSVGPPPGSPTGLTVNVVGNAATFTWTAPASGGPVGDYVLIAGQTPGFATPLATFPLPASPTSYGVAGIPPGIWYVRIHARNAGGLSAQPTNEVQLVVAGPTLPGAPTLNAPTVSGNNVGLSWAPGAGGAPTSYTLVAALNPGGAPIATVPGLTVTSLNVPGVPSGTYFVRIGAVNAVGASPPSNEVTVVVP